ncbi:hypothetical protein KP509_16G077500 [Ceratopteris richardii]|uniref:Cytochrome c oxidase subunit 5C n=1 Tax=Ceratopteris richardii TaxID=49495 RepID=A0A8T2T227_CERRI|nr:hypothetical protein KP509_16G077500 [Ceratopteris richardii]
MGLASHAVAATAKIKPNPVKEIIAGLVIAISGGAMWKMYQLNDRRKTAEFYAMLDRGEITVVVDE